MTRLLKLLQWLAAHVPIRLGNWIADRVGEVVSLVGRRSWCAVCSNMGHVLGPHVSERQVRRSARQVFRNSIRNYYDLLRVGRLSDEKLDQIVDFDRDSLAMVQQLAAEGKGILVVTPHWGAFDITSRVLVRHGLPISFLVARYRPAVVSEWLNRLRSQRGLEMIWIDEGLTSLKKTLQALRAGRLVGLLPDRNMDHTGITIPFFGDTTVVATGLAKMALRSHAPIVPGFCLRLKQNRYMVFFTQPIYPPREGDEPARIRAVTNAVFAAFEKQIGLYPDQWVLLQPVWPDAPCPSDPGLAPV
ncbi:MAG: lysophospholipid acyltransferase family protein [Chloroflexia bacterium]